MTEKKYFVSYDSNVSITSLAQQILTDPDLPQLKSIRVGMWDADIYGIDPQKIFDMIIENKEKFQHIEALYIGDMEQDENEVSWINQCCYEGLLAALPQLKSLTIKGSEGLSLGKVQHEKLEHLEIISGGLPREVVTALIDGHLPSLTSLILYMGVEDYGGTCEAADFEALANKDRFPKLKTLGFVNSEVQDELVQVILSSNLLPQLETIMVSYGSLTDKGGQLILDAAGSLSHIKHLNARYHYLSTEMMEKLKALPFEVDVEEQEFPDEFDGEIYLYPMITE